MENELTLTPNKLSTHDEEIASLRKRSCPNPQSSISESTATEALEVSPKEDYFNANSHLGELF